MSVGALARSHCAANGSTMLPRARHRRAGHIGHCLVIVGLLCMLSAQRPLGHGGLWAEAAGASVSRAPIDAQHVEALAREELHPEEAAFVTIFYDFGADSDDLLLATRVLMRSIRESNTRYRKIVVVPEDGIRQDAAQLLQSDGGDIEILQVDIANVFLETSIVDHRAQLSHMRNKLVLWDDPTLAKLKRIVYVDPENLVLRNMDEIFACKDFCAVDNGQSIVYSNSLLVINPANSAARTMYSDAVDSFWISGRAYNWVGITQGFIPGLFEAFEESPLFYQEDDDAQEDEAVKESEDQTYREQESFVRRLPFYYSINHMVFYERLNWDLYKCKDKNIASDKIPGPMLSYKYSGATVKPWFWVPYIYFQVFWYWQDVRERLNENHFSYFVTKFSSISIIFWFAWWAYVILCLKLHNEPNGRMRRLSSWSLPVPGNAPPMSLDVFNSRFVRRLCQFSCNFLLAVSSVPILSSSIVVMINFWISIQVVPASMHPRYAAKLWVYVQNLLILSVLLVYNIAHTFRTVHWKPREIPTSLTLLLNGLRTCARSVPVLLSVQLGFLYMVGRTDWFKNPVLRPTVLIASLVGIMVMEIRIIAREMRKAARK